jgi:hypothetical protein
MAVAGQLYFYFNVSHVLESLVTVIGASTDDQYFNVLKCNYCLTQGSHSMCGGVICVRPVSVIIAVNVMRLTNMEVPDN